MQVLLCAYPAWDVCHCAKNIFQPQSVQIYKILLNNYPKKFSKFAPLNLHL